jgi:hypothetical protein
VTDGSIRAVLAIGLTLLLATGSGVQEDADFRSAVKLLDDFQDQAAQKAFWAILARTPPRPLAARCHFLLGRIAVNQLDAETAEAEFLQALRLDPFLEPGSQLSPKGRTVFERARERYTQAPLASPGDSKPTAAVPAAAVSEPAATESRSRLPAYLTGAGGAAVLATAGVLGWLSQQSVSSASAESSGSVALGDLSSARGQALAANVLYGVGGAALVTAVILFFVEGPSAPQTVGGAP